MKKIIAIVALLCMVFALCACGGSSKEEALTFVTGGETGTYYGFGSVIAQYVSANTDLSVTAVTSNGSQANIEDMAHIGAQIINVETFCSEGLESIRDIVGEHRARIAQGC